MPPTIFRQEQHGYLASIEWRFLPETFADLAVPDPSGGDQHREGAVSETGERPPPRHQARIRAAWTRPRIPLLPGEAASAMSRVLLVADSGSGVGASLPSSDFIFINVDLTVVLPRDPQGEWLLLESSTTVGSDGTGLAVTRLSDPLGAVGEGLQTLLVAPRG
jgi:hypothetical protein